MAPTKRNNYSTLFFHNIINVNEQKFNLEAEEKNNKKLILIDLDYTMIYSSKYSDDVDLTRKEISKNLYLTAVDIKIEDDIYDTYAFYPGALEFIKYLKDSSFDVKFFSLGTKFRNEIVIEAINNLVGKNYEFDISKDLFSREHSIEVKENGGNKLYKSIKKILNYIKDNNGIVYNIENTLIIDDSQYRFLDKEFSNIIHVGKCDNLYQTLLNTKNIEFGKEDNIFLNPNSKFSDIFISINHFFYLTGIINKINNELLEEKNIGLKYNLINYDQTSSLTFLASKYQNIAYIKEDKTLCKGFFKEKYYIKGLNILNKNYNRNLKIYFEYWCQERKEIEKSKLIL